MRSVIENESLKVTIDHKGAELVSLISKTTGLEYMWSGDPAFWGKHSPVLFPIVGTLKSNTYYYRHLPYVLSRHGFARDEVFAVDDESVGRISFLLQQDDDTLPVYPFNFDLKLKYLLDKDTLSLTYEVKNTGDSELLFSVGGHPAFKVPLTDNTGYNDYYLQFGNKENTPRWPISKDGLIETTPQALLENTDRLPLTKDLFMQDALVLKHPASSSISLRSNRHEHGWTMEFPGFPFLGIWAAKGADFVCVEPWCGIADSVDTDQQLKNKEGINKLTPGEVFQRTWIVHVF